MATFAGAGGWWGWWDVTEKGLKGAENVLCLDLAMVA